MRRANRPIRRCPTHLFLDIGDSGEVARTCGSFLDSMPARTDPAPQIARVDYATLVAAVSEERGALAQARRREACKTILAQVYFSQFNCRAAERGRHKEA